MSLHHPTQEAEGGKRRVAGFDRGIDRRDPSGWSGWVCPARHQLSTLCRTDGVSKEGRSTDGRACWTDGAATREGGQDIGRN